MDEKKAILIQEQSALDEKLERLNDFNQSELADQLDPVEKNLMVIQAGAMYTYNECLKARLERM